MTCGSGKLGVLFVCSGNICRSPTAEAVFAQLAREAGLAGQFHVDSAGTESYHIGEPPDLRSQGVARLRGYDLSKLRARVVAKDDFIRFRWILAMDRGHLAYLKRRSPPEQAHKLELFLRYADGPAPEDVPDPYYGGPQGFENVLDLIESAATGLLRAARVELDTPRG